MDVVLSISLCYSNEGFVGTTWIGKAMADSGHARSGTESQNLVLLDILA